MSTTNYQQ